MLLACLYLSSFYTFLSCTNIWSFLLIANLHMVDRFALIYLPMVKLKYITNWGFPHCCFSNIFLAYLVCTFCLIKYSPFHIITALTTISLSIQSIYILTLFKRHIRLPVLKARRLNNLVITLLVNIISVYIWWTFILWCCFGKLSWNGYKAIRQFNCCIYYKMKL